MLVPIFLFLSGVTFFNFRDKGVFHWCKQKFIDLWYRKYFIWKISQKAITVNTLLTLFILQKGTS